MSLLPLHTADGFDDAAAYTDAFYGAENYLIEAWQSNSMYRHVLEEQPGGYTTDDFYNDIGILGLRHQMVVTETVGTDDELDPPSAGAMLSYIGIGDLGNVNTNMRKDWWNYLKIMRKLLDQANSIDPSLWPGRGDFRYDIKTSDLPDMGTNSSKRDIFLEAGRNAHQHSSRHDGKATPDLFVFRNSSINPEARDYWWVPYAIVSRMVQLHNELFGTSLNTTDASRLIWVRGGARGLIRNVTRGLGMLQTEMRRQEDAAEAAELAALEAEAAMIGQDQVGFVLEPLTSPEMETLAADAAYQQYFSTTFNKDLIAFVPIIQNFFLTGKYFQTINESFYSSNALALEILLSTIRNNDNYKKEPNLRRVPPTLASQSAANTDPAGAARDFILKMVIMTPINILKGICELLDPHIGITKLIKKVTGYAFGELAEIMNEPAEGINETRKAMIAETEGEESDAYKNFRGINGDDLLKFILCILEMLMTTGLEAADAMADIPLPPNFFPAIKRDGVDFTGKVSGLLMMPPTPFGLIYLLLGLINFGDQETVDVLEETPPDPACPPPHPEDPSVTVEATVDQCAPDEVS
jgi:hypothetical protein